MTQIFEIPLPPSVNATRGRFGHVRKVDPNLLKFYDAVAICVQYYGIKPAPNPCRFELGIVGGKGWRVNADLDNRIKPCLDALQHAGVLEEDNVVHVPQEELLYRARVDRSDIGRCFIRLSEPRPTWLDEFELPAPSPVATGVSYGKKRNYKTAEHRRADEARAVESARVQGLRRDAARRRRRNSRTARRRRQGQ